MSEPKAGEPLTNLCQCRHALHFHAPYSGQPCKVCRCPGYVFWRSYAPEPDPASEVDALRAQVRELREALEKVASCWCLHTVCRPVVDAALASAPALVVDPTMPRTEIAFVNRDGTEVGRIADLAPESGPEFRGTLRALLNRASKENGSNTPDFILAAYLIACLDAFDAAVNAREKWYRPEQFFGVADPAPTKAEPPEKEKL